MIFSALPRHAAAALFIMLCCCTHQALSVSWKSCASSAAAFDIQAVNMQPEVVPPGGGLNLAVNVLNKQASVTGGSATVKVYYYGWWVLTATGTVCEAPSASSQSPGSLSSSLSTAHRRMLLSRTASSGTALSKSWSPQTWLSMSPGSAAGMQDAASTHHLASSSTAHRAWQAWQEDTCVLPQGPLQLHHQANLPAIAPRGNYRMQLSAADANTGMELFCLDVWFTVAS